MYAVVCADTLVLDDIPIIDKIIGNTNDIFVSTAMIFRTGAFSTPRMFMSLIQQFLTIR
jgi:hypothetical protein